MINPRRFSDEQIKNIEEYFEKPFVSIKCPYCGAEDITTYDWDYDVYGQIMSVKLLCEKCYKSISKEDLECTSLIQLKNKRKEVFGEINNLKLILKHLDERIEKMENE